MEFLKLLVPPPRTRSLRSSVIALGTKTFNASGIAPNCYWGSTPFPRTVRLGVQGLILDAVPSIGRWDDALSRHHHIDEIADPAVRFQGVPQGHATIDSVSVLPPVSVALEDPGSF